MAKVTRDMLDWVIEGITFSQYRRVSADLDSKLAGESKQVEVEVTFAGATLRSVFEKAFGAAVISWANGPGRKHIGTLGKKVTVSFSAPGKRMETTEELLARALQAVKGLDAKKQEEYLALLEEAAKG
jgi:hypothetical protein